ncbi:MAG: glycosyltransferase family 39 protein [Gemmatimonadaceae bacterium]|nr:glycosyltransferase family 39 protein [Gemmatimonadaceae bacterium]
MPSTQAPSQGSTPVPARAVAKWSGAWSSFIVDLPVARAVVGCVALLHLAIVWLTRVPGIGWGEDDAQYFQLARNLVRFGYHEQWDIAAPLHVRYPPLFPAFLAAVGLPAGWNVDAMLLAVALCSALAVVVFFDAARRVVGVEMALLASILWALNPLMVKTSGWLLSEPLFNLLFVIALWGIAREEEGGRYGVLAGAALSAAALTRTAGLAMVCGLIVWWLFKRRWRRAATLAVVAGGTIGVWLVYSFMAPESESQRLYSADLAKIISSAPQAPPRTNGVQHDGGAAPTTVAPAPPPTAQRLEQRLLRIATNTLPTVLSFRTVQHTIVDNVAWLVVMVITASVGAWVMLRRWPGAALALGAYLALLTVWTWMMDRYFSPVIPLIYLAMLLGASSLLARLLPRWRTAGVLALVVLLMLGEIPTLGALTVERSRCDRDQVTTSPGCYPPDERAYLQAAQWVRDSTPPGAVFMASKEAAFFTHAGRRTVNQIAALREDSATIIAYLRRVGVTHVVVGPVGVRSLRHGRLMARVCDDLILLRAFPREYAVLRVREPGEARDGGEACDALRSWRDRVAPADPPRRRVRSYFERKPPAATSVAP